MRKFLVTVGVVFLTLVCGCSLKKQEDSKTLQLQEVLESCFSEPMGAENYFKNSLFSTKFAAETDECIRSAAITYFNHCSIKEVKGDQKEFSVTLVTPDLGELGKIITKDSGFQTDYNKLVAQGMDMSVLRAHAYAFITNVLQGSTFPVVEEKYSLEFDGQRISDDTFMCLMLSKFWSQDFLSSLETTEDSRSSVVEVDTSVANVSRVQEIKVTQDFVDCKDGNNFSISNIKVLKGTEALQHLRELSSANKSLVPESSVVVYYIEFEVQNLSPNELSLESGFCCVDSNYYVLQPTGSDVIGLNDTAVLAAYGTAQMSCCVFGDNSSGLFWWHDGYSATVHINL